MIRFWAGYNKNHHFWKLTDCKDCLPCEAHYITERELPDIEALRACCEGLFEMGNDVSCEVGSFEWEKNHLTR